MIRVYLILTSTFNPLKRHFIHPHFKLNETKNSIINELPNLSFFKLNELASIA